MKDSLKVEQSQFDKQDELYRQWFNNNPHRIDYNKYPDIQRADIDLVIKNRVGRPLKISEKYRPYDYGDILFEIFSTYPNKHGWSLESKADILSYWFPTRVVIIDIQKVVETFERNEMGKKVWLPDQMKELITMEIDGNIYHPYLIRAVNEGYSSISLAFKFEDLENLGIKFSVIPLG